MRLDKSGLEGLDFSTDADSVNLPLSTHTCDLQLHCWHTHIHKILHSHMNILRNSSTWHQHCTRYLIANKSSKNVIKHSEASRSQDLQITIKFKI